MSSSHLTLAAILVLAAMVVRPAKTRAYDDNLRAKRFVDYYEATVRPLEIEAARAYWTANITGKEEDFQKKQEAEERVDVCLSDPERFAELKAIWRGKGDSPHLCEAPEGPFRQMGTVPFSSLLARQITVLYLGYLDKQIDHDLLKKMSVKSNAVERAFNVFRPKVNGKEVTDNDVRRILRESRDSTELRAVWEAGKKIGPVVVGDLKELVTLRNQAARKLGFANYHVLQLYCGEQSQEQVLKLFDELDELTRAPFHAAKAEIDAALAKSYGISVAELQPWHYHDPFFQEAPAVLGELPGSVYKQIDPIKACRRYYDRLGLPVDDILNRSSLYEQPGKNPHAFCTDIDRAGDIRVLENIVPGREWLATTLHELGHAVYSKNVGPKLPYILHTDAHPLCTEGVAMMFEQFADSPDWLATFGGAKISNPEQFRAAAAKLRRNQLLVFSRYCQVMFRFEMEMYNNPDQDLSRLWWDLVEKYQELKRPAGRDEPDYASKYHLIGAPAYYHNYMLGQMFASQVHHALVRSVLPGSDSAGPLAGEGQDKQGSPLPLGEGQGVRAAIYVGNKVAGAFMKERVFAPGLTLPWNELTRHATGESLNPKAFAEDLNVAN